MIRSVRLVFNTALRVHSLVAPRADGTSVAPSSAITQALLKVFEGVFAPSQPRAFE